MRKITLALMLLVSGALMAEPSATIPAAVVTPVVAPVTPVPVPVPVPVVAVAPTVAVQTPAAPPVWAQDLLATAAGIPVVGPVVTKVLMYVGIVSSILTMLVAFLISALSALMSVFTWAGLTELATALAAFQAGKVMYYLKFFSLFNAQKKDDSVPPTAST